MKTFRRRLQFHGVDANGASRFTIYSLSRAGTQIQHQVLVHFENGEFHCSCEDHFYRGSRCKHVARACDWEKRRRREEPNTARFVEHSCPGCLGYFDGPGDCPTNAGGGARDEHDGPYTRHFRHGQGDADAPGEAEI